MRARAIKDLTQLPDEEFFRAVSEGLSHTLANATRLESSARALKDAGHSQGTEVLRSTAGEEAAGLNRMAISSMGMASAAREPSRCAPA